IRERFEPIPSGGQPPAVRTVEPPQRSERRVTMRYPAGAPQFEVAYHSTPVSNPDAFPMLVLDAILSGGKPMGMFGSRGTRMGRSSRLYRALVDGGLASSAGSSFVLSKDPYLFGIDATPRPGVSLEDVERAAFQEVEKLQQFGVSQEELDRALKQARAQLVYGSESVTDQAYWLGALETIDSYETYGRLLDRVSRVTPEDVKRVAEQYLTETNRTVGWLIPTQPAGAGSSQQAQTVGQAFFGRKFWVLGSESSGTPAQGLGPAEPPAPTKSSTQRSAPRAQNPDAGAPAGVALAISRVQLDNGIVVLGSHNPNSPQVVVRASLLAGSVFDAPEKAGIARFTAPMLIRGTEARSFQALSEETDGLGMALNVDAGRMTAQLSVRCLKEDFQRGLELLAELLRRPTFPEDEVEKLRSQIITGLREQEVSARVVAERRFLEELYPAGHPYRLWPSGSQDTVNSICREELLEHYRRYYRPDTLTIAVVGDVAPTEALERIQRLLGDWRAEGMRPQLEIPPVEPPSRKITEEVVPAKFQSEMVMGLPAISRKDPDYYALRLGNLILGELGLSGRLGAVIRDQYGLAYHVSSDLQAGVGPSPWAIRAGVNPANVDKAIDAAIQEIERWRSDLVAESEIDDGKSFLIGSLPIALETGDGIARTLLDIEFYQLGLDYLERYPKLIEAVTREAIRDAVRRWIHPEQIVTVVAGPPARLAFHGV
ncbi:MAG: M16 family metallopeptidase, partial [Chloroflexota bacterium]